MPKIWGFSCQPLTQVHIIALTVTDGSVPSSDKADGLFHLNQLTLTSFNYLLWIGLAALQLYFFLPRLFISVFFFQVSQEHSSYDST